MDTDKTCNNVKTIKLCGPLLIHEVLTSFIHNYHEVNIEVAKLILIHV